MHVDFRHEGGLAFCLTIKRLARGHRWREGALAKAKQLPGSYEFPISGYGSRSDVYRRDKFFHSDIHGIVADDIPRVTVHYGLHAPFCVTATEATEHIYRRSLQSIRRDRADYYILVCVSSGSLGIVYNGRRHSIGRGDFFVVRTNVPYEMHVRPGPEDRYAQICISLPADVAAEFHVDELAGVPVTRDDCDACLAQELVRTLFDHGKSIVAPVATSLLSAILLEVTRMAPNAPSGAKSPRSSMRDVRRDAVLAYLDSHCTNPDLRAAMVAEACQMSVRYMSALLSEQGLSFSGLVRLGRIQRIRSWLADPALANETIASLAYRAGFSSVSHCILSFRRAYGCTPSKLRRGLLSGFPQS